MLGTAYMLEEFGKVVGPGTTGVMIASMAGQFSPLSPEEERVVRTCPSGDLLNLEALSLERTDDNEVWYRIAKRANQLHVQFASAEWGRRGARVNSVSPGITSTPMALAEMDGLSGGLMRHMLRVSAAERIGTPADIAEAVAFLLGSSASYITGTDLLVDGGVVAVIADGASS